MKWEESVYTILRLTIKIESSAIETGWDHWWDRHAATSHTPERPMYHV